MSTEQFQTDFLPPPPPPTSDPNLVHSEPITPDRNSIQEEEKPKVQQQEEKLIIKPDESPRDEQMNEDPGMDEGMNFDTPGTPSKEETIFPTSSETIILSQTTETKTTEEQQENKDEETIIINQSTGDKPKKTKQFQKNTKQKTFAKYSLFLSIALFGAAIGCILAGLVAIIQPISSWIRTPSTTAIDYTPLWQGIPGIFVGCLYLLNGVLALIAGLTVKAQKARVATSIGFVLLSMVCLILGFGMQCVMPLLRVFVDQGWVKQDPKVSGVRGDRNLVAYITAGISGAIILVFCSIFMVCGSASAVLSSVELFLNYSDSSSTKVKRVKQKVYHVPRV